MNIHEEDYPYSIYKSSDGDELLDAHNDIIAVFDPHTEPEIEHLIAAAPELKDSLKEIVDALERCMYSPFCVHPKLTNRAKALLRRIEGEEART